VTENAFQQTCAEVARSARIAIEDRLANLEKVPDSPIELAFLIGLMGFSYSVPRYDFGDTQLYINRELALPVIRVELQAPVGEYRADFLLTVIAHDGAVLGRVVIECDGHAFHERTKEQAAHDRSRDRAMTLAGYTVMRFTGSEIHNRLVGCITDAHWACWNMYTGETSQG
jgi:very-short-patch-repair endonuclease